MTAPRSLLVIARYFPPLVSGGARRPYLLARALMEQGVRTFVVAPVLPAGLEGLSVRHPFPEPIVRADGAGPEAAGLPTMAFGAAKDWVRRSLVLPDPDLFWCLRAERAVLASGLRPDVILSTSPPESTHVAGVLLKRKLGGLLVTDFRDEWLARPFLKQRLKPVRRHVERAIARWVLSRSDLALAVDRTVATEITALAPGLPTEVLGQFALPPAEPLAFDTDGPNLVYSGSFSLSDPDCRIDETLRAFAEAFRRRPEMRLHLIGHLTRAELDLVDKSPARGGLVAWGPLDYETTRRRQAAADGFVVTCAASATAVPGKIYEYRAVGAPIIAVGDGPWRRNGGYAEGDPVDRMLAVGLFRPDQREGSPPMSPAEAAEQLLAAIARIRPG